MLLKKLTIAASFMELKAPKKADLLLSVKNDSRTSKIYYHWYQEHCFTQVLNFAMLLLDSNLWMLLYKYRSCTPHFYPSVGAPC